MLYLEEAQTSEEGLLIFQCELYSQGSHNSPLHFDPVCLSLCFNGWPVMSQSNCILSIKYDYDIVLVLEIRNKKIQSCLLGMFILPQYLGIFGSWLQVIWNLCQFWPKSSKVHRHKMALLMSKNSCWKGKWKFNVEFNSCHTQHVLPLGVE